MADVAPDFRCRCGARLEAVEVVVLGDREPHYVPGVLLDRCRCLRCLGCASRADAEGKCPNIACWHFGELVI